MERKPIVPKTSKQAETSCQKVLKIPINVKNKRKPYLTKQPNKQVLVIPNHMVLHKIRELFSILENFPSKQTNNQYRQCAHLQKHKKKLRNNKKQLKWGKLKTKQGKKDKRITGSSSPSLSLSQWWDPDGSLKHDDWKTLWVLLCTDEDEVEEAEWGLLELDPISVKFRQEEEEDS